MGFSLKKAIKSVSNAASNVVKEVGTAANNTSSAVGKASTDVYRVGKDAADIVSPMVTGGLYSTDGKSGMLQGNSVLGAYSAMAGVPTYKKGFAAAMEEVSKPVNEEKTVATESITGETKAVVDPYLEEELENARKRGRASTVLAGAADAVGNVSAKRSLLGIK